MRLVIDLQGAQGSSRRRGIGRYSRELALAMAASPRGHEVIIALNGALAEPAAELATRFAQILPRRQIQSWYPPCDIAASRDTKLRGFAESLRAAFLASLEPDLVHVSSLFEGLGDDVITLQPTRFARLPVVATCYDLIPLIRHDTYFGDQAPLSQGVQWYYRCAHEMAMSDGLLAISQSSRSEAIRHLPFDPEKVFDIQCGVSPDFRPVQLAPPQRAVLLQRYGLRGSFILFLGAGDIRKNEAGLMAAYARLPVALRERHQLLIVGKMDPALLYATAEALDVAADHLVIVPFVRECDLNALYSACALFVFPSLHEGFGLPVAEAMACGAPAIASNTSSLPEVIGRDDAIFDPADPDSIADCMRKVLENQPFREQLAEWGPVQAARFTWPATAARAWDALEAIHAKAQDRPRSTAIPQPRPRLALVSPFPPQATGIADYSHALVFSLARHYDITIVTEAVILDARLAGSFPLLRPDAFLRDCGSFDRVLYQIGNSGFHRFQIENLLVQCPGVIVLHDAFLSGAMDWQARMQGDADKFRATLLQAHGYPALRFEAMHGREAAIAHYPCSLAVLQAALGIIQHSLHGAAVLARFYGAEIAHRVAIIPLLRAAPWLEPKAAARARLGVGPNEFVTCCFGEVTAHKCPELIAAAWRQTGLAGKLVFVGGGPAEIVQDLAEATGISCTGRVSAEDYNLWLAAADLAVQWRQGSRGETSAAIADALVAGLPLIFNRHGSAAEIPENIGCGLADDAKAEALAETILALHNDPARRQNMAEAAQAYALTEMRPASAASRYAEAIEHAYARPQVATSVALLAPEIAAAAVVPGAQAEIAKSLSRSLPAPWRTGQPRLLIDVAGLEYRNRRSGFARVFREIFRRVLEDCPSPYRGLAIRARRGNIFETFSEPLAMLGHAPLDLPDIALGARSGDILICAGPDDDWSEAEFTELKRVQLAGTQIILIVAGSIQQAPSGPCSWIAQMLAIADGAVCLSNAVAEQLMAWLDEGDSLRDTPLPIGFLQPGADFDIPNSLQGASGAELRALAATAGRPTLLLSGTTEPWEGYAQALDAFELLWHDGVELGLTLAGQPGWDIAPLLPRLESCTQSGELLHWLPACDDAIFGQLGRASVGRLIVSTDAGFSLPIIEAAEANVAILMRDLPALRAIATTHARYFCADSPEELANAIRTWQRDGFTPGPAGMQLPGWNESYRQLCGLILAKTWPVTWRPGKFDRG